MVNQTIGDGLMSLFGAPRPLAEALGPMVLRGKANAVEVSGLRAP